MKRPQLISPSFLQFLLFTLLHLPRTGADTAYVTFSPAIYLFDNLPSAVPSASLPAPYKPTTTAAQWANQDPYTAPSPYSFQGPPSPYAPEPPSPYYVPAPVPPLPTYPDTVVLIEPPASPTVDFLPATPIATLSCAKIGEPWWGCLSSENCAFDDIGDVACCPVGQFCRGIVNYGNGAGPRGGDGSGTSSDGFRTGHTIRLALKMLAFVQTAAAANAVGNMIGWGPGARLCLSIFAAVLNVCYVDFKIG